MSGKNESIVLIPILSKQENNPDFLIFATENATRALAVVVIDKTEMIGPFGFASTEIKHANTLLEQVSNFLAMRSIPTETILEWGNVSQKIMQLAELRRCGSIAVIKQPNEYYKKIVKEIKEHTKIPLKEFEIPVPEPTTEKN